MTTAGGAEKVLHFGSKATEKIELRLRLHRQELSAGDLFSKLTLSPTGDDGLFPSAEVAAPYGMPYEIDPREERREAGISKPKTYPAAARIRECLRTWRVFHLNDTSSYSPMRKTVKVDDNRYLRPDGSNLAAFLYYLREKHENSYALIVRTVQRVAPFFDDFLLEPRGLDSTDIRLEWRHKSSDQYFDASSLSDGTLRFIVLATLFLQPEMHRPSVILVDEPELGLHPYAIGMLAALVRQASVGSQVILSTQSSTLLDHFKPEDVLVANRVDGGTQLERQDPDRLAKWLEDYSLGQLWEKNEIGGRPVPG